MKRMQQQTEPAGNVDVNEALVMMVPAGITVLEVMGAGSLDV